MKVKKFVANSMSEAMKQIRKELGSEAVILNSKEIETGGFLGFFTKKNIEVIAAVDSVPTVRRSVPKRKPPQDHIKPKEQSTPVTINTEVKNEGLEKEVKELKSLVNNMTSSFATQFHDYPEALKNINQILIDQEISPNIRIEVMKKLLKNWYVKDKETTSESETLQWAKGVLKETIQGNEMGGFAFNKKFLNLVGPTGVGKNNNYC
ncbi:hypothetical protein [Anaerobacillus sp. CMMVII]|uniref:flagellar biosynthesis protein FlhF n=1 Tax=Anaerobacillus sp. CMMVII TaxID=2755588 RepID=UPI0028E0A313|nr:hypothetical protein [Anaerobacillus sp. CMMVII]